MDIVSISGISSGLKSWVDHRLERLVSEMSGRYYGVGQ